MNGENIGDLFEEYLHKAGEYKQNGKQGSLQDAFETLGLLTTGNSNTVSKLTEHPDKASKV